MTAAVLAVDGGNSKTDVALVAVDGTLLAAVRGPSTSHQEVGLDRGMRLLRDLAEEAARAAGLDPSGRPLAAIGVHAMAGADYPSDVRRLRDALRSLRLSEDDHVVNDCLGALWSGASEGWGIGLVCGEGINGAAIAPGGRQARFDGVGSISGDWGGGHAIGLAGLAAAVRARDGRGPRTSLERGVPAAFGRSRPSTVTRAVYEGRIPERRLSELSPVVFAAAIAGDPVARGIVDRLADELAVMAVALARRTGLTRKPTDVVLAGGVFRTDDTAFYERIDRSIRPTMPAARVVRLTVPPVAGPALEGLDRLSGGQSREDTGRALAGDRIRAQLAAWDASIAR